MKDSKKWTTAALLVIAILLGSSVANAAQVTVVEGTPVFFGGLSLFPSDDSLPGLKLDWLGLASDLEWRGATLKLGGAVSPSSPAFLEGSAAYTFGFGGEMARVFSLMAAAEGSVMAYLQDLGTGPMVAVVGEATGSTARIGLKADFGAIPSGFDTRPARLIGQDSWVEDPGRDLAGKGWIDVVGALQSSRTRADSWRIGYMRELGEPDWRSDIGYIARYSPEGLGVSIRFYSGLAFGGPRVMLLSKLTFRADVTDRSGAEIDLVVQGGSGSEHAWISGTGWLSLGERADLKLKVCAPIMSEQNYDGPELFRPIDWAAFAVGLDFNEGFISSLSARYDLRTKVVGLELASRF
ncbi:MAG: hypothetical protein ACOX4C_02280 [Bacillota bacterium]|nr:hypothetical protein [Bacillota bacterium]